MLSASSNLNLIPDDVLLEKNRRVKKQKGLKFGILLVIILSVVGVGLVVYNITLQKQIKSLKSEIDYKNTQIDKLKEFGKVGYSLGIRLENVKNVLKKRPEYSNLIQELQKRTPDKVSVNSYSFSDNTISISAVAKDNYTPIAEFQDNLLKEKNEGVDPEMTIFTDVKIGSANYNKQDGSVSFKFTVSYNSNALTEDDF